MKTYINIRTVSALIAFAGLGAATMQAQMPPQGQAPQQQERPAADNVQQQLQQVQMELQQTQAQLQPAIQQANEQPEVRQALLGFDKALTEHMVEASPDQSEAIHRRSELFEKLISNRDFGAMDADAQQAYQQHVQEYQELQHTLMDSERQAMNDPTVQERLQAYQATQREALVEVEPQATELLQRQDQLRQQFQTLQQQLQQSAGGQPPH